MWEAGDAWAAASAELIVRAHTIQPSHIAAAVQEAVEPLKITVSVYLQDLEQRSLRLLPTSGSSDQPSLPIDTTMAGRCFMTIQIIQTGGNRSHLWVPIVNGTERLGVLEIQLPTAHEASGNEASGNEASGNEASGHEPLDAVYEGCKLLSSTVGHLITSKLSYGDTLHRIRRTQPMATSGEFLWPMLPPLTFATDRVVITAVFEPCYDVGGDAYDYAVDDDVAHITILDGVGHGMSAAIGTAMSLAALRGSRRAGGELTAMARAVDNELRQQFSDSHFVTAVLARLDTETGVLNYVNAGHPPPVIIRGSKVVRTLSKGRRLPLGFGDATTQVAEETLEPGDRVLFYTDGVTEARHSNGSLFGLDRLIDLVERGAADGLPPAEALRRISHAILEYQNGTLQDDASLLMVDWSSEATQRSLPH